MSNKLEAMEFYERGKDIPLCSRCKKPGKFHLNQHYCIPCARIIRRDWYRDLPNKLEKRQQYRQTEDIEGQQRRRRERVWLLKLEMIKAYGGKCSCCGLTEPRFLTLEHLLGGGNAHRERLHKSDRTWLELKLQGWPQEGYILFCWNCQMGKTHYGICPHKLEVERAVA